MRTTRGSSCGGAKYENGGLATQNQGFVKPTIAQWGTRALKDYAIGFITDMNAPGLKLICRDGDRGGKKDPKGLPDSGPKFDEIDTLLIFDNVLVPWENVLFCREPKAAGVHKGGTLHRYVVVFHSC